MLTIISNVEKLPYSQVMRVYEQSIRERTQKDHRNCCSMQQLLNAEQDLYAYLQDVLEQKLAVLAFWTDNNKFVSALRLEKYRDGLLLTALETAPRERSKGYASMLVSCVVDQFSDSKIYSHIADNNLASISVHLKCGFQKISSSAVFLDGSQSTDASTYLYEKN